MFPAHSFATLQRSNLTPGITRRPVSLKVHESGRVAGRVHAVVRRGIVIIPNLVLPLNVSISLAYKTIHTYNHHAQRFEVRRLLHGTGYYND